MNRIVHYIALGVIMVMLSACQDDYTLSEQNTSVEFEDTTPPVITLKGDNPLVIAQGESFRDPGATAVDDVDGEVAVAVSGSVDTATVGSYTLIYTARDSAGNEASVTRTVEVKDLTPPTFTSPASVSVPENQTNALTLQATDPSTPITYGISGGDAASFDVDATTGFVAFKTAPDFETRDTYTFTATATDSAGNVATQSVTVSITDVPEGVLKKTGQTQSYDANGNEVIDGSLKDDGYYQKGVDPSYSRDDATGIVTDHITGLQWQDDYSDNNGSIKKANWDDAVAYCEGLTLGGHNDWRLPEAKELDSIVDYGRYAPAIDPVFEHTASDYYWSASTHTRLTGNAWGVYFEDGYRYFAFKYGGVYVRCVRSTNE